MKHLTHYLFFTLLAISIGCNNPEVNTNLELSTELENVLGDNLNTYILPESSDYANIPQDSRNSLNEAKIELGKLLFHETAFSNNTKTTSAEGTFSCATCHIAESGFQSGLRQALGEGGIGFGVNGMGRIADPGYILDSMDVLPLKAPTVINSAYQENMLWSGSLGAYGPNIGTETKWGAASGSVFNHLGYGGVETQARAAFKGHRFLMDDALLGDLGYKPMFDQAFPNDPVSSRYSTVNYALAIAAYERTVLSNKSPFQNWLKGDKTAMNANELKGAVLFFDKGKCATCHSGPALNSMEYYSLGFNEMAGEEILFVDTSFVDGVHTANLGRGGFTLNRDDYYKFKVPQLYNLVDARFYGHGASFNSVFEVVEYINKGVSQNPNVDQANLAKDFVPLQLTDDEVAAITSFIETGLYDNSLTRYVPSSVLSGNCIPNNDQQSRIDLGCN